MKLKNANSFDVAIQLPYEQLVKANETFEIDTKEKDLIKSLKLAGFEAVKEEK